MTRTLPWVWLIGMLCLFACDFAANEGHTYLNIKKEPAWSKFDEIEILWKDPATGDGAALFKGPPGNLLAINRFRADGYRGQPIQIYFRGYIANTLAFEEKRGFDGKNPTTVTKEFTTIISGKPITTGSKGPVLSAIRGGKSISIGDSLTFALDASIDSGILADYAWDFDGDGKFEDSGSIGGSTSLLQSGHRYPDTGTYSVALKVRSQADSTTWATLKIQVLRDAPTADAGKDQSVHPGASVTLLGIAGDGLGVVVGTAWRIGAGEFIAGSSANTFTAPSVPQDLMAVFRVTDDDSISSRDTVIIHVVPASEPILASIAITGGSLDTAFQAGDTSYTVNVPNPVEATTLTATLGGGTGTLQVNGGALESGVRSGDIPLLVGENLITVTLTSPSGSTIRYRIRVIRAGSGKELLTGLTVSAGPISPEFSPDVVEYSLSVAGEVIHTDVTAGVAAGATLHINGSLVPSGTPMRVNLSAGPNAIAILVSSPEGVKKNYTVVVNRAPDGNADLVSLKVSNHNFSPDFNPSTIAYSLTVEYHLVHMNVTPLAQSSLATVTVNGNPVLAGNFGRIELKHGPNPIKVEVKAQNGTVKTYTITITRQLSNVAYLSGLTFSAGLVYPEYFGQDSLFHSLSVANSVASITIKPTLKDTTARIAINGSPAANKTDSDPIPLPMGASLITIAVTAQNGTKLTYTVAVKRHAKTAAIACGSTVSLGLREDGTVFTWGGWMGESDVPMPADLKDVKAIAAGESHYLALKTNGTVVAWGLNDKSQADVPVGLTGVKAVSAGYWHSVALKTDGTVVAWGSNSHQQLAVPVGLSGVKAIDAGGSYTIALLNDSTLVGWGHDVYGETKQPASGFKHVAEISAGGYFNVARKTDGTVFAWGNALYGQTAVPPGLSGVKAITTSMDNTLALKQDGSFVAWGNPGSEIDSLPSGTTGIKSFAMCSDHGIALKENGSVMAWGANIYNQTRLPKDLD